MVKRIGYLGARFEPAPDGGVELARILSNPTYRANAPKLQKAIATANELSVAADLIEDSLGVTKKASHTVLRFCAGVHPLGGNRPVTITRTTTFYFGCDFSSL